MDYFLYSGEIARGADLEFIEFVSREKQADSLTLLLATPGGSPDAAYKMGKYIQARYDDITVLIPGFCKSAGTLLAISAKNLAFTAYGELGPLDVQMVKTDNLAGLDSGLNISEAFLTLESRAREQFHSLISEIISSSGGVVSFQTASHSAAELVGSMYGPIFGKMDPEEVGSRARAMRIGEDYGNRLNRKFRNLKPRAIELLSRTYSSHGFVIDKDEAMVLFSDVREATQDEKRVIDELGIVCRHPANQRTISNITEKFSVSTEHEHDTSGDQEAASTVEVEPTEVAKQRKKERSKRSNGPARTVGADSSGADGAQRA